MSKITIGADPEYMISDGDNYIPANSLCLQDCDFGCDGHCDTAELRPTYGDSPFHLVANIRALIRTGLQRIPDLNRYALLAGHFKHGHTIGGHIHLGGLSSSFSALGAALDDVLGPLSDYIDNIPERSRRRTAGYGKTQSWRTDSSRIEYRLPGSWLLSPHIAFINLWLAYAVAETIEVGNRVSHIRTGKKEDIGRQIIAFAEGHGRNDHDLFIKVADSVFNSLPLNWNEDFKGNW
jgi:hypothetical protein